VILDLPVRLADVPLSVLVTGVQLHEHFCLNGENMCSGNFKHALPASELRTDIINTL
jgi:hypothetical protein